MNPAVATRLLVATHHLLVTATQIAVAPCLDNHPLIGCL